MKRSHSGTAGRTLRGTAPLLALLALGLPRTAAAGTSGMGEEYLSVAEAVPPNIIFVIDLSADMLDACSTWSGGSSSSDTGDTGADTGDTGSSGSGGGSTTPCIETVVDAIDQVTQHFDWARYGVVGTARHGTTNTFTRIAPLGSTHAEISTAISGLPSLVASWHTSTRNLAEVISRLGRDYLSQTTPGDGVDDDGDGIAADWTDAPIQYSCQETHIIVLAKNRPTDDSNVPRAWAPSVSGDILCDASGITTHADPQCKYDNAAYRLYQRDLNSSLTGDQTAIVHTVGLGVDSSSIAEALFGHAADVTNGEGVYTVADSDDEVLSSILTIMSDIREGFYSRSTPVLSANGEYLVYSFYEIEGGDPLAKGHVRAYQVDTDPDSTTYGQVEYLSGTAYDGYDYADDFGGALWDAGTLLVSRPVFPSEYNPDDRDGAGKRDIYTFVDEMVATRMRAQARSEHRMSFDRSFVLALRAAGAAVLDLFLDTSSVPASCPSSYSPYDLDQNCTVDSEDYQELVDFVRGYAYSTFRYLDQYRGTWKLGDAPYATPVVVEPRNNNYSVDPSYRAFLQGLVDDDVPAMVFAPANDGMLHAFFLEDRDSTPHTDQGEEAWAWIPAYLLYRDHGPDWTGRLIDLMLYGRTFLLDGTPVVEDVWIDDDGDGAKADDGSEWHRVILVQQGKGGPVTLALDITDPLSPKFLWEQEDLNDTTAQGYGVSRPVIANVYDARDPTDPKDRWVAIWGSGRAVPHSVGVDYYNETEANLYMWAIGDDYWTRPTAASYAGFNATGSTTWLNGVGTRMDEGGSNGHPEASTIAGSLNADTDAHYEYAYIAANLTVIDADSDGDADTIYFPVTTTYGSYDPDRDSPGHIEDPGETWIWKAIIDSSDPADIQWCSLPFYDPYDAIGDRPPVYYAATATWFPDGSLGLYWGTGTPFDRTSGDQGYLFAVKDPAPGYCHANLSSPGADYQGEPIVCDGFDGYYPLEAGEGLTAEPIVYAGVVYFSTYAANADLCEEGEGRLYGLNYQDCSPGLDTNGDGVVDSTDDDYIELDGYPSQPAISDFGTIFVGTSNPTVDGSGSAVTTVDVATDPFLGTAMLSWMEIY